MMEGYHEKDNRERERMREREKDRRITMKTEKKDKLSISHEPGLKYYFKGMVVYI